MKRKVRCPENAHLDISSQLDLIGNALGEAETQPPEEDLPRCFRELTLTDHLH